MTTPATAPAPAPPPDAAMRTAVLEWARWHGRDLPWRHTRDPWAVLVSELMSHQTQLGRVEPRWQAFIERFPTVVECAAAPAGEVVRAWAGLGYNRRAIQLHRSAVAVTQDHGGVVPDDLAALTSLPGIGAYTARAVLAFAYDRDVGVVDTNTARVFARALAGRKLSPSEAQQLADACVPAGQGWAWNQAVLDLGATVCRSRVPACDVCPLGPGGLGTCRWAASGQPQPDPARGSAGTSGPQSAFAGSDRQGRGRLVAALRGGPVSYRDPGLASTGLASTGLASAGLASAGLASTDLASTDLASTDLASTDLASACGWPGEPERAARIARSLLADGLAVCDGDRLTLPS